MADDLKRVVAWTCFPMNGTDYCALWHTAEGWLLKDTVAGVSEDQRPILANYQVHCDENWLMHRVQVHRTIGEDTKALSGHWLGSFAVFLVTRRGIALK